MHIEGNSSWLLGSDFPFSGRHPIHKLRYVDRIFRIFYPSPPSLSLASLLHKLMLYHWHLVYSPLYVNVVYGCPLRSRRGNQTDMSYHTCDVLRYTATHVDRVVLSYYLYCGCNLYNNIFLDRTCQCWKFKAATCLKWRVVCGKNMCKLKSTIAVVR